MTTDRPSYIAGLRALADLLEQHDEMKLPYHGSKASPLMISHLSHNDDARHEFAATVRALPGARNKAVWDDYFDVTANLHGLHVKVTAYRDTVCERVVTGTREVTREVPDPDALAAVPTRTVTETVEDVEWVCAPVLA